MVSDYRVQVQAQLKMVIFVPRGWSMLVTFAAPEDVTGKRR